MLSARSFIVLHFTFRSTIHFELIFLKGIKFVSIDFFFLHMEVQVVFVEKTSFSIELLLILCQGSIEYIL